MSRELPDPMSFVRGLELAAWLKQEISILGASDSSLLYQIAAVGLCARADSPPNVEPSVVLEALLAAREAPSDRVRGWARQLDDETLEEIVGEAVDTTRWMLSSAWEVVHNNEPEPEREVDVIRFWREILDNVQVVLRGAGADGELEEKLAEIDEYVVDHYHHLRSWDDPDEVLLANASPEGWWAHRSRFRHQS